MEREKGLPYARIMFHPHTTRLTDNNRKFVGIIVVVRRIVVQLQALNDLAREYSNPRDNDLFVRIGRIRQNKRAPNQVTELLINYYRPLLCPAAIPERLPACLTRIIKRSIRRRAETRFSELARPPATDSKIHFDSAGCVYTRTLNFRALSPHDVVGGDDKLQNATAPPTTSSQAYRYPGIV
ncbi:hypothetical protein DBV15_07095 [Temnothorax longispinosus]|uniref:Uncharacterized protein n=1 Tax=Temnothorax longispinosus TaxID=300112 RepID=A0A4S2KRQ7_9HYME|nr:hypothetical protein DBV15_07095 [Temnothorax longispinosus]